MRKSKLTLLIRSKARLIPILPLVAVFILGSAACGDSDATSEGRTASPLDQASESEPGKSNELDIRAQDADARLREVAATRRMEPDSQQSVTSCPLFARSPAWADALAAATSGSNTITAAGFQVGEEPEIASAYCRTFSGDSGYGVAVSNFDRELIRSRFNENFGSAREYAADEGRGLDLNSTTIDGVTVQWYSEGPQDNGYVSVSALLVTDYAQIAVSGAEIGLDARSFVKTFSGYAGAIFASVATMPLNGR